MSKEGPALESCTRTAHLSNEALLKNYQQADGASFEEFFERNHRLLFNYLYSRLGDRLDAEEALQKTFLRLHKYILTYDPQRSALGWTFSIARRVLLDIRVERTKNTKNTVPLHEGISNETHAQDEARRSVIDLLKQLEPKDRALIERRYLLDEDFEEIAEGEGMTAVNVRQRISRALRRLRAEFFPV